MDKKFVSFLLFLSVFGARSLFAAADEPSALTEDEEFELLEPETKEDPAAILQVAATRLNQNVQDLSSYLDPFRRYEFKRKRFPAYLAKEILWTLRQLMDHGGQAVQGYMAMQADSLLRAQLYEELASPFFETIGWHCRNVLAHLLVEPTRRDRLPLVGSGKVITGLRRASSELVAMLDSDRGDDQFKEAVSAQLKEALTRFLRMFDEVVNYRYSKMQEIVTQKESLANEFVKFKGRYLQWMDGARFQQRFRDKLSEMQAQERQDGGYRQLLLNGISDGLDTLDKSKLISIVGERAFEIRLDIDRLRQNLEEVVQARLGSERSMPRKLVASLDDLYRDFYEPVSQELSRLKSEADRFFRDKVPQLEEEVGVMRLARTTGARRAVAMLRGIMVRRMQSSSLLGLLKLCQDVQVLKGVVSGLRGQSLEELRSEIGVLKEQVREDIGRLDPVVDRLEAKLSRLPEDRVVEVSKSKDTLKWRLRLAKKALEEVVPKGELTNYRDRLETYTRWFLEQQREMMRAEEELDALARMLGRE